MIYCVPLHALKWNFRVMYPQLKLWISDKACKCEFYGKNGGFMQYCVFLYAMCLCFPCQAFCVWVSVHMHLPNPLPLIGFWCKESTKLRGFSMVYLMSRMVCAPPPSLHMPFLEAFAWSSKSHSLACSGLFKETKQKTKFNKKEKKQHKTHFKLWTMWQYESMHM